MFEMNARRGLLSMLSIATLVVAGCGDGSGGGGNPGGSGGSGNGGGGYVGPYGGDNAGATLSLSSKSGIGNYLARA